MKLRDTDVNRCESCNAIIDIQEWSDNAGLCDVCAQKSWEEYVQDMSKKWER